MAMRGGCLFKGCLAVPVLALVLVVIVMVSFWNTGRRAEAEARDQVTEAVGAARARLARAAADGVLLDTEIQRALLDKAAYTGKGVRRSEGRVTVTAPFVGQVVGNLVGGAYTQGCYRFEIVMTKASSPVDVRELPYQACLGRRDRHPEEPAAVARDIAAELRTAVTGHGQEGARVAEVWRTGGVEIEDHEVKDGQLVLLVWLSGGTGPRGDDCYEFRVKERPTHVTTRKLKPDGCYRIQREQYEREEKADRAELAAGARKIARQLRKAAADGALTDEELPPALALPTTDVTTGEATAGPPVQPESVERSTAEVVVFARVQTAGALGCYRFRARLTAGSVTGRLLEEGCPTQRLTRHGHGEGPGRGRPGPTGG
ncbi:hypothetical protein OHS59_09125 [Streptomyces sp. NBC_00414]|uniref:hypothetical protein n=1 Tax=Streptomyces sp. NBC_00414 TaxID=2975739 RepID=UPI002E1D7CC6